MKLRNKKTGKIFDWREDLMPFGLGLPHPKSLAELNEEWEDYEPAEPLIKDPKIRKAVRAWAEANGIDDIVAYILEDGIEFAGNATKLDIRFVQNLVIDTDRKYTIPELCGEEEE